jgi:hypothetical protein
MRAVVSALVLRNVYQRKRLGCTENEKDECTCTFENKSDSSAARVYGAPHRSSVYMQPHLEVRVLSYPYQNMGRRTSVLKEIPRYSPITRARILRRCCEYTSMVVLSTWSGSSCLK